jgi:hypothetical protein
MKDFYFTFLSIHYKLDGVRMKDHWIRIKANSSNKARRLMMDWCDENMGGASRWGMQYKEEDFESHYFPGGEYLLIVDE